MGPTASRSRRRRSPRGLVQVLVAAALLALATPAAASMSAKTGSANEPASLNAAFRAASAEFGVPRDLLVAVAYTETRLDDHGGQPSVDRGYGLMHLVDNPVVDTLSRAQALTGAPETELRESSWQNVRGGAALLRDFADRLGGPAADRKDLGAWYPATARYSNAADGRVARLYADDVYRLLRTGVRARTADGELVVVRPHDVRPQRGEAPGATASRASLVLPKATTNSPDYPGAQWVPAYKGNYSDYSRGTGDIRYIVIHTTQGSYAGAISWFQNPSANVSAHYVIRSADGQITQTVREQDVAWHAGNWTYNLQSIGIEHEGWIDQKGWYTDAMYRSSALLVRHLAEKYDIPMDRQHILGHVDVPQATHTDPGPYWDWKYYMSLVRQGQPVADPQTWSAVVDNTDPGFTAGSAWGVSQWSPQRYGADYRYADPSQDSGDTAWYRFSVPADGQYDVSVRYPSNAGYNSQARYKVRTVDGTKRFKVDERSNGGQWVDLGEVSLAAGEDLRVLGISRRSSAAGYVVADAVRLLQR